LPARLLLALPDGTVTEHPRLLAAVRSGDDVLRAPGASRPVPLPAGATLSRLPGRRPLGIDPDSGSIVCLDEVRAGGRRVVPDAVAAVFPPGWTRAWLPAIRTCDAAPELPQWAWTAAGWDGGFVAHALRTDRRTHWSPEQPLDELERRVESRRHESPLVEQLARCALEYRCFTARNIFHEKDEGALPSSSGCNARCVGCISAQDEGGVEASHERIRRAPGAAELAELGARHLERARESAPGRAMVSFGQGCEGEPLTRAKVLAEAIRRMRVRTARGSVNVNTNGSRPEALKLLADAGLDACRISLNSACADLYEAYYRPIGYGFAHVRESLRVAREAGLYVAVNLLVFPGVTDRAGEVDALVSLLGEFRVHQLQTRNLAMDPDRFMSVARGRGAGGPAVGVANLVRRVRRELPGIVVGNYARGLRERRGWNSRPAT